MNKLFCNHLASFLDGQGLPEMDLQTKRQFLAWCQNNLNFQLFGLIAQSLVS